MNNALCILKGSHTTIFSIHSQVSPANYFGEPLSFIHLFFYSKAIFSSFCDKPAKAVARANLEVTSLLQIRYPGLSLIVNNKIAEIKVSSHYTYRFWVCFAKTTINSPQWRAKKWIVKLTSLAISSTNLYPLIKFFQNWRKITTIFHLIKRTAISRNTKTKRN